MSEIATLVRRYVDHYNSNDVDGMLDCCVDDVIFETVSNPGGSIRLNGKIETDQDTSRRLFTLICALHWRG